ncbi:hypothetical protein L6452_17438 [Arctium lappa]|uniref:Uncharacterized protein n=1 Tax=Arctium lappa TaxID=4217 RepID=A0ACB9C3K5_ARCLA|nr:hypothetical protein L6452_17438 [Arctium lappa]
MFDRCGCGRNHLPTAVLERFMMFSLLAAAAILSIDVSVVDVRELLGCCSCIKVSCKTLLSTWQAMTSCKVSSKMEVDALNL